MIVSSSPSGVIPTFKLISKFFWPSHCKYGKTAGSCFMLSHLKGSNAAIVTIHGDIVDAKLLPKNGPRGTYSHPCISLALQSLNITLPKMCSSAFFMFMGSPRFVCLPIIKAISSSISSRLLLPKLGKSAVGALLCPLGLCIDVPLITILLALP